MNRNGRLNIGRLGVDAPMTSSIKPRVSTLPPIKLAPPIKTPMIPIIPVHAYDVPKKLPLL